MTGALYALFTLTLLAIVAWLIRLALGEAERSDATRMVGFLALFAGAAWLAMAGFYAPLEKVQGLPQKIFYAHVPCWPPAYLGFALTAVGGIGYLVSRKEQWDHFALAAAEVGIVFCTLGLITGPIWAKPIWGHWWVWDLRLTSALVLWFVYVAYLFLRGLTFGSDTARTFTSIYGILGTAAIPFVYFAVDIAKGSTLHPSNPARAGLPAEMSQTLAVGMLAYVLCFGYLAARRLEIARLDERLLLRDLQGGA
ncbi:MAG: cytochrome c biogenesis protein CcsA [bacterium]|nr:cytochrome c biogenesis protein CcsA [bacterium]